MKTANKQYTTVKNDYEITFTNETSVIPCEDAQHLPSVKFDFVSIGDLENVNKDAIVGESVWTGLQTKLSRGAGRGKCGLSHLKSSSGSGCF